MPETAASGQHLPELSPGPNRFQRILINSFLLFHIAAILSWSLPLNSLLVGKLKQAVAPYMLWSGLWQVWDMFAPDPRRTNVYLEGEVTFRNGATAVWKFPKMQDAGFAKRYYTERYRKWANDELRLDANAALWPDAARYIARQYANPVNPPVVVRLVQYLSEIPPPARTGQFRLPVMWNRSIFYTHPVQPWDWQ